MRRNFMKSVKGTETEKNLLAAFAGELELPGVPDAAEAEPVR